MTRYKVLIVDDDPVFREALGDVVQAWGCEVSKAADGAGALKKAQDETFDLVLTDLRMEGMDGMTLLQKLKQLDPDLVVVLITGHGSVRSAVEAMRRGAFDYVEKPWDESSGELEVKIMRALEKRDADVERRRLRKELSTQGSYYEMVGRSPQIKKVFNLIEKVSETDVTVLIQGETGTGKELVARAVHFGSARKDKPFIVVNCPAFAETLLESELFGHEKGSFTGALQQKPGRFELADGGTLFLDEVGDLPGSTQSKLLRVLQEQEFERVGGTRTLKVNVRIVAATNRDLEAMVKCGEFREDLFFRLNIFPIRLPTLIQRREDIPLLAAHFLRKACGKFKKEIDSIAPEALSEMMTYSWPGNVRELMHAIETAVLMEPGRALSRVEFLGRAVKRGQGLEQSATILAGGTAAGQDALGSPGNMREVLDAAERMYLVNLLRKHHGRYEACASEAGISMRSLYRKIQELDISKGEFL